MKIPISLTATSDRQPATALLLPTSSAAALFALIEQLGLDPLPPVFATAEGFLVRLPTPREAPVAGVVRLRSLAPNLYLPVDAALTPPLLADEAQGLTRPRGLVFLPGNRVLEFAVDRPLAWDRLVCVPLATSSRWRSLPEPPTLASELIELKSLAPPPLPDAILEQGRTDIGTESPRPERGAGIGTQVLGTSLFVAGHTMAWLGTKLGLSGIAGKGADLLQRALDRVPRLSEFLMNQQEAMLRRLLKDFREGKIEQALRRALPLGGPDGQPVAPATNAQLPSHSLLHSLQNLLGGRNLPAGAWFTPDDLYWSLQAEYRNQAEAAARAGDFRRAAFIYAKLLNDLAGAARILAQGGLHRDAAVLYEKILNNPRAAAQEWEAAGEIDKAVELLVERLRDHLAAAELLDKVGATERALVQYRIAADTLAQEKKFFEAGGLLRTKARRLDLALQVYDDGWNARPLTPAVACGLFLADHYSQEPNLARFRQLVREASACVPDWTDATTVHFFNQIARLARRPSLAAIADRVLDDCLMALAASMADGRRAKTATTGNAFFPADSPWAAPVARDGSFAFDRLARRLVAQPDFKLLTRLGHSTVRAVCHMPLSDDLFLGFENGEILHHRPVNGETRTIAARSGPILGLLSDCDGQHLIALAQPRTDIGRVLVGARSANFGMIELLQTAAVGAPRLMARFHNQQSPYFGAISGADVIFFRSDNPSWRQTTTPILGRRPLTGIVGSSFDLAGAPFAIVFYETDVAVIAARPAAAPYFDFDGGHPLEGQAIPGHPDGNTLFQAPVIGQYDHLSQATIQWTTQGGQVYATKLRLPALTLEWPPDLVATARPAFGIHGSGGRGPISAFDLSLWDRLDERTLQQGNPVAAFAHGTSGVLVIDANGTLTRLSASRSNAIGAPM